MSAPKLTRRTFLEASAAAVVATQLKPAKAQAEAPPAYPENGTLIPDEGWRLWIDEHAEWKNDAIFLPEAITRDASGTVFGYDKPLPVNQPTGGWESLGHEAGIPITLPSTVEQHYWGKYTTRPYTPDEYRYAADDPIPQLGAYFGVSWWYRPIDIPASMQGKRIFLHIRGAHLRAEVYLNKKLVGYSIMEELPFECDLTHAADPGGLNIIAIRITNPFGRYDWVDGLNAQWGALKLYRSHGFGGLDRGMTISAHEPAVRITDAYVLNKPDAKSVAAFIKMKSEVSDPVYSVNCLVTDPANPKLLATGGGTMASDIYSTQCGDSVDLKTGEVKTGKCEVLPPKTSDGLSDVTVDINLPTAKLWDLASPNLYHLEITATTKSGKTDTRTIAFGFRSFAPEGLGKDAIFRLNSRRIRIYTAISWGFWGINGMYPTPELAVKEVTQAQKLGLNCLNFHRNLAKEEVLRAHDTVGLLRYMEPGAGKMAIGKPPAGPAETSGQSTAHSIAMEPPTTSAEKFAQRYMFVKCVEMVKAFRSHPSVIEYCLQNEIGADLRNPDTIAILAAMRAEDPSRCIVLNDGFVAPPRRAAQAWYEPWNDKLHRSDEEEWGGWWNQHQGAGDQWYDEFYKSPKDFTYSAPFKNVLTEFGEMEGCATPDNHSLMLHQLASPSTTGIGKQPANKSYDLVDHQQIVAAYDRFLDKWNFRAAFPATESLWLSIGRKCYDTWQNYLENARISDDLDFAAISGWETTAIENHSGIVDNLRNYKADPTPIIQTLQPIHPVAKQRSMCTALGQRATFDLYLLNDTGNPAPGTLTFTAITPSGKLLKLVELPAPAQTPDVFSYLLKESFTTPPLTEEGMYRFKFAISSTPLATHTKEIWVTESNRSETVCRVGRTIAVSGITSVLRKQLVSVGGKGCYNIVDFTPGQKYDAIITAGLTATTNATQNSGDTTGLEAQPIGSANGGTDVGGIQTTKQLGHIDPAILDAVHAGTPLLAIPQADTLSDGVAKQLAAAGAFTYTGVVGDYRAPWMGNWHIVRKHAIYAGLPVDQAMGIHYQSPGRQANGLLVDRHRTGAPLEIIVAYSRDHDRQVGAATFTTKLGAGKLLYHRVPDLHPVLQQRLLANALVWLTT
jgi:beta-galactosidase